MIDEKQRAWRRGVGNRFRLSIAAIGKKPADIARLYGKSQQLISNYIRGERPLDVELAVKLHARFGITLEWLYLGDMKGLPYELAQKMMPISEEERSTAN